LSKGIAFADRDFFRQRLDVDELRGILGDRSSAELFSARSPSVAKLGLNPAELSDGQMLEWMAREPRLFRRPFMLVDGKLMVQPKPAELDSLLA